MTFSWTQGAKGINITSSINKYKTDGISLFPTILHISAGDF